MATPNAAAQPQPQRITPQQQDQMATRAILASSVNRIQQVASVTVNPTANPVMNIQPLNVGLIKRFIIHVLLAVENTGTVPIDMTAFGLANIFGQNGIQYTDLNNYLRVNTSGQHLTFLASAKRRRDYGATVQDNTTGTAGTVSQICRSKMLNVEPASWFVFTGDTSIPVGASTVINAYFELPLSYTDDDLRGAVWANVLNAVQQITLTFNSQPVVALPNDNTYAIYSGATGAAGIISTATVTIYQEYLDQLPKTNTPAGPVTILPALSLSTVYELKSTLFNSIPANQEFYIPYANQRSFISTFAVFNFNGTGSTPLVAGGRDYGGSVNYWALLAANASYIWKLDPDTVSLFSREHFQADLPAGCYYFPSRRKNLATLQFGNLQLTLNSSNAAAGAYVNVMWEMFALQNTLQSGASLASGSGN